MTMTVEQTCHAESTLFKVKDALERAGLSEQQVIDAISEMLSAGILFREICKNPSITY